MEPQEGDIAEDGAGNFLVRRGNDWYPAQQDGRPLERIPRPDYGANHFQLPNGDIVRQGPRGGQETVENFGGAGGGAGGSGLVSADQRGRYAIGADPLVRAERNLAIEEAGGNPLNRDWGAVALNSIDLDPRGDTSFRPFAPLANIWGGQDYQNAQQALSTYEASLMPIQSGASVTASEAARQIRADFPAVGDSEETLRRKAANRRDRINAIFTGIGRPAPFSGEDATNPSDVSTEREVAALAGMSDGAVPTPGAGPDSPVDISGLSASDLMNLQPGQYIKFPDGRVERLSGAPRVGANGEEVAPGVFQERVSPEQTIEARREDEGLGRRADTFVRGIADAATFGLSDEITAGLNTVAPLDRGARGGWDGDWGGAYRQNLDLMRGIDEADAEQMPLTRGAGQITGAIGGGVGAARMAPQVLRQAPRVAGATRGADTLRRGANVARLAAGGAAGGGAYGLGASEGNILERAPNALEGAAIGGVLGPVAGVVGDAVIEPAVGGAVRAFNRTLRPNALVTQADEVAANMGNVLSDPRAQAVQTLTDNGVYLTSGQRAGGLAQTVENLAQRAPILGTAIRGARSRGQESLNRAVGNRALDPIGEGVPANVPAGGETVSYVSGRLGQEFDRAAYMVPEISATPELRDGVSRVVAQASDLPEAGRQQLAGILESRLARLDRPLTGPQYRDVEREIGTLAAQYGASPDPAQQQMGSILSDVGEELRTHLGRVNPEAGEILRNASEGWADFVRMRQASVASGGRPFSPGQLSTAVRTQDSSVAHGAVGRGEARMQDLSRAASTVMPDSFGNPGTADTAGWGGLIVGSATAPVQTAGVAAGLGVSALPYLAAGRNVVERLPAAASRQGDNVLRRFVARGFSEEEARGLTAAAVDPARAREVIDFLATRMNRQEARSMLRAIRFSASRGAGEYAGDEE